MRNKNWARAVILSFGLLSENIAYSNTNLESKVTQLLEQQTKQEIKKKSIPYKIINEIIIKDFLDDYLNKITPQSNNFKKLKKKYGKKGVLERYCSAHRLCLNLAFENLDKEILKQDYVELSKKLSEKQYDTSKGLSRVNYLDKRVVKSFANWGRFKTENFKKLLRAGEKIKPEKLKTKEDKEKYIKQIHNKAYTRKEYVKYVKQQNIANDKLYASMKKTLGPIEKLVGGGEIKKIAKITREVYKAPLNKYFRKNE